MDEPLRTSLQARLAALLSEHDVLVNRALLLRGRMLELERLLTDRAVAEENAPQGDI